MNKSAYFDKIIALDCETSGLNRDTFDPSVDYQIVSIGMLVADTKDYNVIDELYVEIKWNGDSKWSDEAERIHGFSKSYLDKVGLSEEDAVEQIALFLDKHYGTKTAINTLGQNVSSFDVPFLRALLHKYDMPFKFAHRHVDTFSLSMPTIGAFSSNELFELMGFEKRVTHNSLEDARMALKSVKTINRMWRKAYG